MKISRKNRMLIDILILAKLALDEMSEDEIQEDYGSDYYYELKRYLYFEAYNEFKNGLEESE